MRAVIGRVRIKPDRVDEALAMLSEQGVAKLPGMAGSAGGYWARSHAPATFISVDVCEIVGHAEDGRKNAQV